MRTKKGLLKPLNSPPPQHSRHLQCIRADGRLVRNLYNLAVHLERHTHSCQGEELVSSIEVCRLVVGHMGRLQIVWRTSPTEAPSDSHDLEAVGLFR
jgi:hypothetical protein